MSNSSSSSVSAEDLPFEVLRPPAPALDVDHTTDADLAELEVDDVCAVPRAPARLRSVDPATVVGEGASEVDLAVREVEVTVPESRMVPSGLGAIPSAGRGHTSPSARVSGLSSVRAPAALQALVVLGIRGDATAGGRAVGMVDAGQAEQKNERVAKREHGAILYAPQAIMA